MLTIISNQQSFNGRAKFIGQFSQGQKQKFAKLFDELQLSKKPYDIKVSDYETGKLLDITAGDLTSTSPIAPRYTTIMNPQKDSFEFAVKSTMENFENILNNIH